MSTLDATDPQFVTVLADFDRHCRWTVTIENYDTGDRRIDLLIVLDPDGDVIVATRPPVSEGVSWSPPFNATRR